MANFTTLNEATTSSESDVYLTRQGSTDVKVSRETLAAGVANARWVSTADYDTGSVIVASDDVSYRAVQDNGPNTSAGAQDPTIDDGTYWTVSLNIAATDAQAASGSSEELIITPATLNYAVSNGGAVLSAMHAALPAASQIQPGVQRNATNTEATTSDSELTITSRAARAVFFAVDQLWQDLTSARAFNTTYTNTNNKPLVISVVLDDSAGNVGQATLLVDGERHQQYRIFAGTGEPVITIYHLIPSGSTYEITTDGNESLIDWWEYR